MSQTQKNKFVVFEGLDGVGKSTQAEMLASARKALYTKQPGGYEEKDMTAQVLRNILLDRSSQISDFVEAMIFSIDRSIHTEKVLRPALNKGKDVVCDRFVGSFLAYQGYGRGGDIDFLKDISKKATGGLEPDLVILLQSSIELPQSQEVDRIERENDQFRERVMDGYLTLLEENKETWCLVEVDGTKEKVAQKIKEVVSEKLGWFK